MAKKDFKKIELPPKYVPKKSEPYMCPEQLAYFYQLLSAQKQELENNAATVLNSVRMADQSDTAAVGDDTDSASMEQEIASNLRMQQRDNNLLRKINEALNRLDNGTFGYSVISGDEIGIQRLVARPLATMTVEEQEEYEQNR
ncbi:MAG: hypothetical protein KBS86_00030 [Proteobacteria bacterium]|nr:hypothetical protein [Candidatus Enterousia scatequi]